MNWTLTTCGALCLALAGCSSSDSEAGSPGNGPGLEAYSAYCTGTLLTAQKVLTAEQSGVWSSKDAITAPAGTKVLMTASFDKWQGYYFVSSNRAERVSGDSATGLVKDTDFTSDCATDVNAIGIHVLLQPATLYPNQDLTGEPCVLPAATSFSSFSFVNGAAASVTASEIETACGYKTGYSKDFVYAELLPIQ